MRVCPHCNEPLGKTYVEWKPRGRSNGIIQTCGCGGVSFAERDAGPYVAAAEAHIATLEPDGRKRLMELMTDA